MMDTGSVVGHSARAVKLEAVLASFFHQLIPGKASVVLSLAGSCCMGLLSRGMKTQPNSQWKVLISGALLLRFMPVSSSLFLLPCPSSCPFLSPCSILFPKLIIPLSSLPPKNHTAAHVFAAIASSSDSIPTLACAGSCSLGALPA